MGGHEATVAAGEEPRMMEHLQRGVGQHPARGGLDRQTRLGQPMGGAAAGAGEIGLETVPRHPVKGNVGFRKEPFCQPMGRKATEMEARCPQQQLGPQSPRPQRQGHLHR
jgi:hypothetical protein